MHNSAKFIQSNRQAAFFEINFFRCSNPEHIFSPFSNGLDVDKMFYTYVLRYGVATPGTAAQSQGRNKFEVVKVADTALRRWSIDEDTAGLHSCCVFFHLFLFSCVNVESGGMSITAVSYKLFSFGNRFVKSFGLVHGKYRGKLLMCEFFADVYRFNFTDQNLCLRRNCNTGHLSDSGSLLAYDLCIQCAIDKDSFSYFL